MKLKPCPFCGGENNEIRKTLKGDDAYYIQCQNCGAKGGVVYVKRWHDTKFIAQGQAATKWNQRDGENNDQYENPELLKEGGAE